jgi:pimeloyl-ACP methyl ester carboxylesterase
LFLSLLLLPAALYFAFCALLFFAQTRLIFPVGQVAPAGPLPAAAEPLEIAAASGERLRGLHIPPASPRRGRLLILGFGGNGANAAHTAAQLHDLYPEADVVAFHYRGYPPSEGSPSAAALRDDAVLIHDFARARFGPARTIVAGFSIGSGVAAALSARRPVDGLILVTPFDSLARVAAGHYPWLPVRLLFRHDFEPLADLRRSRVPVAIISAGRDTLVPAERSLALRLAAPSLVFDRVIEDAGHNDIYSHPGFRRAMREALRSLRADIPAEH